MPPLRRRMVFASFPPPRAVRAPCVGALLLAAVILATSLPSRAFIDGGRPWPKRLRGTVVYTGDANWVSEDNSLEFNDSYAVEFEVIFRLTGVSRLAPKKTAATYAIEYLGAEVTQSDWTTVEWNFEEMCYAQQDGVVSGSASSTDQNLGIGVLTPAISVSGTRIPRSSVFGVVTPPGALSEHFVVDDQCDGTGGEFDRVWGASWTKEGRYRVVGSTLKVVLDGNWTDPPDPVPGVPTYFHTLKGTLKGLCRGVCP